MSAQTSHFSFLFTDSSFLDPAAIADILQIDRDPDGSFEVVGEVTAHVLNERATQDYPGYFGVEEMSIDIEGFGFDDMDLTPAAIETLEEEAHLHTNGI